MNRFPNCQIFDCQQRGDEWRGHRMRYLTASNVGAWLTGTDKRSQNALFDACCKVIAGRSGFDEPTVFESFAMQRGIAMEPDACKWFEATTGLTLEHVGFCMHESGVAGCSPDGLVAGQNVGFEGKCPLPPKHFRYVLEGTLPDEYRDQVHFSMAVTGASAWYFQSYIRDDLPNLLILVERDDYTNRMIEGIFKFKETLSEMTGRLSEIYDKQNQP